MLPDNIKFAPHKNGCCHAQPHDNARGIYKKASSQFTLNRNPFMFVNFLIQSV